MNADNDLTTHDRDVLATIEAILAGEDGMTHGADSLFGFCAQLAGLVPRADEAFRRQLEARLIARLGQTEDKAHPRSVTSATRTRQHRWLWHDWARQRSVATWVGALLVVAALLLAAFPGLRTAAGQGFDELRRIMGGVSFGGPGQFATFRPAPPFTVKQPGYLPEGFRQTVASYQPGPDTATGQDRPQVTEREIAVEPGATRVGSSPEPGVEREPVNAPQVALTYTAADGQFLYLVERAVRPGEGLPDGEPRTVAGRPATLWASGETRQLTWIEDGTWIELEGTLSEDELLKVAAGLVTTQMPNRTPAARGGAPVAYRELPFCDQPDLRLPVPIAAEADGHPIGLTVYDAERPRLGTVPGRKFTGSILIRLLAPEHHTHPEEVLFGGSDLADIRAEVLVPALAALQDPAVPLRPLPYPTLSVALAPGSAPPCLIPARSDEQGYLVIEVWEGRVNLGFLGAGAELKERAIRALSGELQKQTPQTAGGDDASAHPTPVAPPSDHPVPEDVRRAMEELETLPSCEPEQPRPPRPIRHLLPEVDGQEYRGSVFISLMNRELFPVTENLSYGADVMNIREAVLEPALAALQDPATPMQRLPYPALGAWVLDEAGHCLRPGPAEQGYLVIEVWERQVNLGYGGDGAALKERAITALQAKLRELP